jgi:hypothetical protein
VAAQEHKVLLGKVNVAIEDLSASELNSAIEQAKLSTEERGRALAEASILVGNFKGAQRLLSGLSASSYAAQDRLKAQLKLIEKTQHDFEDARETAEKYIHSSASAEMCDSGPPMMGPQLYGPLQLEAEAGGDFSLQSYAKAISELSAIAPLDPYVLDLEFHFTMISQEYPDVEKLGDHILTGTGQIRVPGYANDQFYWLVVDQRNGKLSTEPDSSHFSLRSGGVWNSALEPFNFTFSEIKGISQSANGSEQASDAGLFSRGTNLMEKHAYALKLRPSGMAPHYSLMAYLQCKFGQFAQQRATYNLGRFVQHVTGLHNESVKLVHPEIGHSGAASVGALGVVGSALGVSNSQLLVQGAQQAQMANSTALTQWNALNTSRKVTFSAASSQAATDLEAQLGLQQSP